MIVKYTTLNVPATATTGTASTVGSQTNLYLQVKGVAAASATVRIEGTIDATNYAAFAVDNLGTLDITADGIYQVYGEAESMRINRTVAGSGTITATLRGLDLASE